MSSFLFSFLHSFCFDPAPVLYRWIFGWSLVCGCHERYGLEKKWRKRRMSHERRKCKNRARLLQSRIHNCMACHQTNIDPGYLNGIYCPIAVQQSLEITYLQSRLKFQDGRDCHCDRSFGGSWRCHCNCFSKRGGR